MEEEEEEIATIGAATMIEVEEADMMIAIDFRNNTGGRLRITFDKVEEEGVKAKARRVGLKPIRIKLLLDPMKKRETG
jgi:hypothetical protein